MRNYQSLVNAAGGECTIAPETPFGWPENNTTVNLGAFNICWDSWVIPKQITVNQKGDMGYTKDVAVIIQGKWFTGSESYLQYFGNVIVDNGGSMTVKKISDDDRWNTFNNITVKNGGTLNAIGETDIGYKGILNLERNAIVKSNDKWSLRIVGGTLNADDSTITGALYAEDQQASKTVINGKITVDKFYGGALTLPTGTTLTVKDYIDITHDEDNEQLVVQKGAVLNIEEDYSILSHNWGRPARILIKSGGTVNMQKVGLEKGVEIKIEKGGVLNLNKGFANASAGGKITGSGTVNIKGTEVSSRGKFTHDAFSRSLTINHKGDHCYDYYYDAAALAKGYGMQYCRYCGKEQKIKIATPTPKPSAEAKKGKTFKVSGLTYKITKTGTGRSVSLTKGASGAVVSVPSKVTYKKRSYAVTSVAAKAFYNNRKLTTITIPASVKTIGTQSFANCTKLKKLNGFTKVTAVGKQAFYKCTALTQIGSKASTITLPAVQKLYSGAFQNCSKISRITISSKSLKTVENKAITGINKKAVIRVPASKLTAYKKIFKSSTGYVKTMKITK
ncbi:MAG: leucine-rich repeat domain-containing protein [Eubacteriales bacterium]|nr:leucine-rich repeat domain-containing protein [Eubacteriales bacterium]